MKMFVYGDKGEAYCESCSRFMPTTLKYRDVPFDDGRGVAKQILVDVCDHCDDVLAVPPQSVPSIRAARDSAPKSLEVNLPAPMVEVLDLAAFTLNPATTQSFRKPLLTYYILQIAADPVYRHRLQQKSTEYASVRKQWRDIPTRRLSMKLSAQFYDNVERVERDFSLGRTELVGSVSLMIKEDIVDPEKPNVVPQLREFAQLMVA